MKGRIVGLSFALSQVAAFATGQCQWQEAPEVGVPGAYGAVNASIDWDPDGSGPEAPRIVLGGSFLQLADSHVKALAALDEATGAWLPIGGATGGSVFCLAAGANGQLYVSGSLVLPGGTLSGVLLWDGLSWTSLGATVGGGVSTLLVLSNGELVAGGTFTAIGGTLANRVARWDGSSWSALGAGFNATCQSLVVMGNGDLAAGGGFTLADGVPAYGTARWDGTQWHSLAGGFGTVSSLGVLPNGNLLASSSSGGNQLLATWNGSIWSPVQGPQGGLGNVSHLLVLPNGDVVTAGVFAPISLWNGTTWTSLASSPILASSLTLRHNGHVIVTGNFTTIAGLAALNVAEWDGVVWHPFGRGFNRTPWAMVALPDGDVVIGGEFAGVGGTNGNGIVRFDGSQFWPLGSGANDKVQTVALLANGDLVAGGSFTTIGGVAASHIARWDGVAWHALGSGIVGAGGSVNVTNVVPLQDGGLLATGTFGSAGGVLTGGAARWDGANWSALGGIFYGANAAIELANGDLLVAGWSMQVAGVPLGSAALWNGSQWTSISPGPNSQIYDLARLPDGSIVAAGMDQSDWTKVVLRWDGSTWQAMPGITSTSSEPFVTRLLELPNGDLLASGSFSLAGGQPTNNLARWDGVSWEPVPIDVEVPVALAFGADGVLTIATQQASYLYRFDPTCPATRQLLGAGCPSSGGANTLTTELPWIGSPWRSHASGLPTDALVFLVQGFASTNLALDTVFSTAPAGCTLYVQPDFVDLRLAAQGVLDVQFELPNAPALVGTMFDQQMVPLALDATHAVTATDAWSLTIGAF